MSCKLYYTINGVKHFNEFEEVIPNDLFNLLIQNKEYKFCRDDGPAVEYSFGDKIWKSSKCTNYFCTLNMNFSYNFSQLNNWAKNTDHLICKSCKEFCKQKCF